MRKTAGTIGGVAFGLLAVWELFPGVGKFLKLMFGAITGVDFVFERYNDPSWMATLVRSIVDPPRGTLLVFAIAALAVIWWSTKPKEIRMWWPIIGMLASFLTLLGFGVAYLALNQPKPPPDPKLAESANQLAALQAERSAKDAEMNAIKKQYDENRMALNMLRSSQREQEFQYERAARSAGRLVSSALISDRYYSSKHKEELSDRLDKIEDKLNRAGGEILSKTDIVLNTPLDDPQADLSTFLKLIEEVPELTGQLRHDLNYFVQNERQFPHEIKSILPPSTDLEDFLNKANDFRHGLTVLVNSEMKPLTRNSMKEVLRALQAPLRASKDRFNEWLQSRAATINLNRQALTQASSNSSNSVPK